MTLQCDLGSEGKGNIDDESSSQSQGRLKVSTVAFENKFNVERPKDVIGNAPPRGKA